MPLALLLCLLGLCGHSVAFRRADFTLPPGFTIAPYIVGPIPNARSLVRSGASTRNKSITYVAAKGWDPQDVSVRQRVAACGSVWQRVAALLGLFGPPHCSSARHPAATSHSPTGAVLSERAAAPPHLPAGADHRTGGPYRRWQGRLCLGELPQPPLPASLASLPCQPPFKALPASCQPSRRLRRLRRAEPREQASLHYGSNAPGSLPCLPCLQPIVKALSPMPNGIAWSRGSLFIASQDPDVSCKVRPPSPEYFPQLRVLPSVPACVYTRRHCSGTAALGEQLLPAVRATARRIAALLCCVASGLARVTAVPLSLLARYSCTAWTTWTATR